MKTLLVPAAALVALLALSPADALAQKGEPCCGIVSIDTRTGLVVVRNHSTGASFTIRLARAEPANLLAVGQAVDVDRTKKRLVLRKDGAEPASMAFTEVDVSAVKASAAPCCSVTGIDARTGVVTARETASGYTFRFKADKRVLGSLKVGQQVFADFTNKTVRLRKNDSDPCCGIIN